MMLMPSRAPIVSVVKDGLITQLIPVEQRHESNAQVNDWLAGTFIKKEFDIVQI